MLVRDKVKNRDKFTPTENQISDYILNHPREVIDMPLDDLAGKLYVSKSTIIRFCKKLGFRGHKELCVQLAREMNSFLVADTSSNNGAPFGEHDNLDSIAQNILSIKFQALTDTFNDLDIDLLEEAADLLLTHKKIRIYALQEDYPLAVDFAMKLTCIGLDAKMVSIPGTEMLHASFQEVDSVAVFVSYSGKSKTLLQISENLHRRFIPIVLVTGPNRTGLHKNAKIVLHTSFHESSPKIGAFGSFTGMSLLLDTIYCYAFAKDYAYNMQRIEEMDNILKLEEI